MIFNVFMIFMIFKIFMIFNVFIDHEDKKSRNKYTGLEIIMNNLDKLDLNIYNIWNFANNSKDLKTLEERRLLIEKHKKKILEKRQKQHEMTMNFRKENYFRNLKRGIFHLIYVIIYIHAFSLQISSNEVISENIFHLFII